MIAVSNTQAIVLILLTAECIGFLFNMVVYEMQHDWGPFHNAPERFYALFGGTVVVGAVSLVLAVIGVLT